MTQSIGLKHHLPGKPVKFPEFVFISDSAMKHTSDTNLKDYLQNPNSMALDDVAVGERVKIEKVCLPGHLIRQLKQLKFQPDKQIQLVSKTDSGSAIVNLDRTLIGMSREIARRIMVTLASEVG